MARSVDELDALVPAMRRLGVVEYDGVRLGPEANVGPIEPSTDAIIKREYDAAERRHQVMFAASSVKPAFRRPEPRSTVVPPAMSGSEHGSGQTQG